jgi:hypothetical protein
VSAIESWIQDHGVSVIESWIQDHVQPALPKKFLSAPLYSINVCR